jgi:hypothetical protein
MSEIWRWRIIRLVRKGRGDHLVLVMRVEASLRMSGMERLCLPVVFVVMVGVIGGWRWRVIWNDETDWRLVVERIVVFIVSHGFKERTGSVQQRGRWWLMGGWCNSKFWLYWDHVSTTNKV